MKIWGFFFLIYIFPWRCFEGKVKCCMRLCKSITQSEAYYIDFWSSRIKPRPLCMQGKWFTTTPYPDMSFNFVVINICLLFRLGAYTLIFLLWQSIVYPSSLLWLLFLEILHLCFHYLCSLQWWWILMSWGVHIQKRGINPPFYILLYYFYLINMCSFYILIECTGCYFSTCTQCLLITTLISVTFW